MHQLTELINKLKANKEKLYTLTNVAISNLETLSSLQEELNNAFQNNKEGTVLVLESVQFEVARSLRIAITGNSALYTISLKKMSPPACEAILKGVPNNIRFIEIQDLEPDAAIQVFKAIQANPNISHINIKDSNKDSNLDMVTTSLRELKKCTHVHTVRMFNFKTLKSNMITTLLNENSNLKTFYVDIQFPVSEIETLKKDLRPDIEFKKQIRGGMEVIRPGQNIPHVEQDTKSTVNSTQISESYTNINEKFQSDRERFSPPKESPVRITKNSPSPHRNDSRDEKNSSSTPEKSRSNSSSRESSRSPEPNKKYHKHNSPGPSHEESRSSYKSKNWDCWRPEHPSESRPKAMLSPVKLNGNSSSHNRHSYEKYPSDRQNSQEHNITRDYSPVNSPKRVENKPKSTSNYSDKEKSGASPEKHDNGIASLKRKQTSQTREQDNLSTESENDYADKKRKEHDNGIASLKRKQISQTGEQDTFSTESENNHIDKKRKETAVPININTTFVPTIDLSTDDMQKSTADLELHSLNGQIQIDYTPTVSQQSQSPEKVTTQSIISSSHQLNLNAADEPSPLENATIQNLVSDQKIEEAQSTSTRTQTEMKTMILENQHNMIMLENHSNADAQAQIATKDLHAALMKMALELIEANAQNACHELENKHLREMTASLLSLLETIADKLPQSIHSSNLPDNMSLLNSANFSEAVVILAKNLSSTSQKTKDGLPNYLKNLMFLNKPKEQIAKKTETTNVSLFTEEQKKFLQGIM